MSGVGGVALLVGRGCSVDRAGVLLKGPGAKHWWGKERQARGAGILSRAPKGATLGSLPRPPEPCHPRLLTDRMKAASARKSPFL